MAMSRQAMIRMFASKRLFSISYEDNLGKEDNLNSFFDTPQ
jgi:hypothetical protein